VTIQESWAVTLLTWLEVLLSQAEKRIEPPGAMRVAFRERFRLRSCEEFTDTEGENCSCIGFRIGGMNMAAKITITIAANTAAIRLALRW